MLKSKITYGLIVLLFLLPYRIEAQQLPIFSQYVLNGFILNPAMAGYDGYTSVNTTARQQWIGFGDAPQTFAASWQTRLLQRSYKIIKNPVRNKKLLLPSTRGRVGLGGYVINDMNGNVSRTGIQFTYAYHIFMGVNQLSFGLAGKVFQYRINADDLVFGRDVDPLVNAGIKEVGYSPDIDFGVYWTNADYFIGASANNLFQSSIQVGGAKSEYRIYRHYWLMGGIRFYPGPKLTIEPSVLLKTTEKWIPQGDFGVRFYYIEDYWAGLAFRTDGSLITMVGMKTNGLFFGYAFDYTFSSIQRFNYGTHELSISFKFGDNARRYRWLRRY